MRTSERLRYILTALFSPRRALKMNLYDDRVLSSAWLYYITLACYLFPFLAGQGTERLKIENTSVSWAIFLMIPLVLAMYTFFIAPKILLWRLNACVSTQKAAGTKKRKPKGRSPEKLSFCRQLVLYLSLLHPIIFLPYTIWHYFNYPNTLWEYSLSIAALVINGVWMYAILYPTFTNTRRRAIIESIVFATLPALLVLLFILLVVIVVSIVAGIIIMAFGQK